MVPLTSIWRMRPVFSECACRLSLPRPKAKSRQLLQSSSSSVYKVFLDHAHPAILGLEPVAVSVNSPDPERRQPLGARPAERPGALKTPSLDGARRGGLLFPRLGENPAMSIAPIHSNSSRSRCRLRDCRFLKWPIRLGDFGGTHSRGRERQQTLNFIC